MKLHILTVHPTNHGTMELTTLTTFFANHKNAGKNFQKGSFKLCMPGNVIEQI